MSNSTHIFLKAYTHTNNSTQTACTYDTDFLPYNLSNMADVQKMRFVWETHEHSIVFPQKCRCVYHNLLQVSTHRGTGGWQSRHTPVDRVSRPLHAPPRPLALLRTLVSPRPLAPPRLVAPARSVTPPRRVTPSC